VLEKDAPGLDNPEKQEPQHKELNDALVLWETVGVELKNALSEEVPAGVIARLLVSKAEDLLASLVAFAARIEAEKKTASDPTAEKASVRNYSITIPKKPYFKIGEVSEILDVEPYVLKYWEAEFRIHKPKSSRARRRLYNKKDLERMHLIMHLLWNEKYTIAGVKMRLKAIDQAEAQRRRSVGAAKKALEEVTNARLKAGETPSPDVEDYGKMLQDIKQILKEIRERLES